MSTKIYEAYRFPRGKLDEFILKFNRICFGEVKKRILRTGLSHGELAKTRLELFGKNKKASAECPDSHIVIAWVLAEATVMAEQRRNSAFNLDCAFNLWLRGRYAYVIPYAMNGIKFDKRLPKWCEFYGWWNNSDREDGVTEEAWEARGRVWKDLALDDWDRTRMSHTVLEMKMPNHNGLQPLLKMLVKDEEQRASVYSMMSSLLATERSGRGSTVSAQSGENFDKE
jgi:hypothetical protein